MPQTDERTDTGTELRSDRPWVTIVWNDPVNLMSYVAWVFRTYFGFSAEEANRRMLQVHNEGRAVVSSGPREAMERHVEAMHEYGLWATSEQRVIPFAASGGVSTAFFTEAEGSVLASLATQVADLIQEAPASDPAIGRLLPTPTPMIRLLRKSSAA